MLTELGASSTDSAGGARGGVHFLDGGELHFQRRLLAVLDVHRPLHRREAGQGDAHPPHSHRHLHHRGRESRQLAVDLHRRAALVGVDHQFAGLLPEVELDRFGRLPDVDVLFRPDVTVGLRDQGHLAERKREVAGQDAGIAAVRLHLGAARLAEHSHRPHHALERQLHLDVAAELRVDRRR